MSALALLLIFDSKNPLSIFKDKRDEEQPQGRGQCPVSAGGDQDQDGGDGEQQEEQPDRVRHPQRHPGDSLVAPSESVFTL